MIALENATSHNKVRIYSDDTWSESINILCDVEVKSGARLTVTVGNTIKFPNNKRLTINGSIDAIGGGYSSKVIFDGSGSDKWDGIWIEESSGDSEFKYCEITGADYGIHLINNSHDVDVNICFLEDNVLGFVAEFSSPFSIKHSDIKNNQFGMFIKSRASSRYNTIRHNDIEGNSQHGIFLHFGAEAKIAENTIKHNGGHGIYFFGCYR